MKQNKINLRTGIVQGRLIQSPANELQWFPQEFWEAEFFIAGTIGINYIELRNFIDDGLSNIEKRPFCSCALQ